MPLPNPDRPITEEVQLPARIAFEREQRGWTYEGLAKRMTEAGCAVQPSGIYKIEKQGRRIVVEELIGFSRVFGIPVERLLLPAEVANEEALTEAWNRWEETREAYRKAQADYTAAADALLALVGGDPALIEAVGWKRWGQEWPSMREDWQGRRGGTIDQLLRVALRPPRTEWPDDENTSEEEQA